jgi:hypothetical protein
MIVGLVLEDNSQQAAFAFLQLVKGSTDDQCSR